MAHWGYHVSCWIKQTQTEHLWIKLVIFYQVSVLFDSWFYLIQHSHMQLPLNDDHSQNLFYILIVLNTQKDWNRYIYKDDQTPH